MYKVRFLEVRELRKGYGLKKVKGPTSPRRVFVVALLSGVGVGSVALEYLRSDECEVRSLVLEYLRSDNSQSKVVTAV